VANKKTNEEVIEYNKKLEEDAQALRDAGIDAETVDTEVIPIPDEALDAIEKLRRELEGEDFEKEVNNVGRLDEVTNNFNLEGQEDAE